MLGFGYMAKECFDYNRDIFKFDQMQRLQRDLLRMEMQVKRFELFREDIRDLVELTVGKMEMYHLVGALFLEFCVAFYVEGKIEVTEVPPFTLALYYLSVAGAFMYLVLAVWLSMHASISSHSFGVRLLTRYVRLPIPGTEQMDKMQARLADFERESKGMLRLPFVQQAQKWDQRERENDVSANAGKRGEDYLKHGEKPFVGGEEGIMRAFAGGLAGEHVTLFRRLQAKWQCFDAYARVAMSLGANQILLSITFYLINVTLVEYRSPTACFALIVVFQFAALALSFLDIAGLRRSSVIAIQAFGSAPCFICAYELAFSPGIGKDPANAEDWDGIDPYHKYPLSPLCFFVMVVWQELLLQVAWPSQDEATLPRRFRSILFLDVYGGLTYDPTDAEEDQVPDGPTRRSGGEEIPKSRRKPSFEKVNAADDACEIAHQALRRWETLPQAFDLGQRQHRELQELRSELVVWRNALHDVVKQHARMSGFGGGVEGLLHEDTKTYYELTQDDLNEDSFRGRLVGPAQVQDQGSGQAGTYYWEVDEQRMLQLPEEREVLTLKEVAGYVASAEANVRAVIGERKARPVGSHNMGDSSDTDSDIDSDEDTRWCCGGGGNLNASPIEGPYVPQRLPWKILRFATRALQVSWLFQGTIFACEELDYFQIDYSRVQRKPESEVHRLRRLSAVAAAPLLRFERLEAAWPGGNRFRPEGPVSCLAHGAGAPLSAAVPSGAGSLLLSGPRELHELDLDFLLASAPRHDVVARGAAALCGPRDAASKHMDLALGANCLLATPTADGIVFQQAGAQPNGQSGIHVSVRIEGAAGYSMSPWRSLAGAQLPCQGVAEMLVGGEDAEELVAATDWCLLLAGWDGGQTVSLAAMPLPRGLGSLPDSMDALVPVFRLPLGATTPRVAGLSLTVAFGQTRLWALLSDGVLSGWEVVPTPRSLGSWTAEWPREEEDVALGLGGLQAVGLCEDGRGRFIVAGRSGTGDARLLAADVPWVANGDTFAEAGGSAGMATVAAVEARKSL